MVSSILWPWVNYRASPAIAYDIAVGASMGHDRGVWSQDASDQRGQPFRLANGGGLRDCSLHLYAAFGHSDLSFPFGGAGVI
jgi:hypothetical protein